MRIGELDRRITLQNYSASVNNYGEQIESYSDYRTVWAKIDFNGGSETDEFNRITAISKVKYFIWVTDVTGDFNRVEISSHVSANISKVVAIKNRFVYSWAELVQATKRLLIKVSSAVVSTFKWDLTSLVVMMLLVAGVTTL